MSVLNLYSGFDNALGAPDMTVLNGSTPVQFLARSSADATTNTAATFVQTRGILAPGTYSVTLVSGSSAWVDTNGNPLDAGSNYTSHVHGCRLPQLLMSHVARFRSRARAERRFVSDASGELTALHG